MPFEFLPGKIPGLVVVKPRVFPDDRGYFLETYKESDFLKNGIPIAFVQDNHSVSSRGTLRGLHYQVPPHAQGKLVRVIRGAAWDVAVDLRPGSPTFLRWEGIELTADNKLMFYVPPGFAHGFVALLDNTEFLYKCTAEFDAASERGIRWDDPDIGIHWPLTEVVVSAKDQRLPRFESTPQ